MREKVMMILAIAVFTCVPMVQLVNADSALSTESQDMAGIRMQSLQTGLNLEALKHRFSQPALPDIKVKQLSTKNVPALSGLKNNTTFTPQVLPAFSNPIFPTPTPTPGPAQVENQPPVFLSDLDVSAEYVKITNTGNDRIIMTGWKISNQQGKSFTFIDYPLPGGSFYTYTLLPRSTVTIHSGVEGNPSSFHLYWPEKMWNDSGDTACLYNPEGVLVSTISR